MLNIPSEVKALFSTDSIHKNFHAHFPNGEAADLHNEDIVAESVLFIESLCSQQYFKFGLAEASSIEFTAVNVPNVRGAVMQCAIEIDVSGLGTTWIQNHPVDSSLKFLEPQTVLLSGSYAYRIPYGEFVVDTCPRDHGAMYRRKITAYTPQTDTMTALQERITGFKLGRDKLFQPSVKSLVHGAMGSADDLLTAEGYTYTDKSLSDFLNYEELDYTLQYELYNAAETEITAYVEIYAKAGHVRVFPEDKSELYGIRLHTMKEAMETLSSAYKSLDQYGYVFDGASRSKISDDLMTQAYNVPNMVFNAESGLLGDPLVSFLNDIPCFYSFRESILYFDLYIPMEVKAYLCDEYWNHTQTLWEYDVSTDEASVKIRTYTDSTQTPGITLSFAPKMTTKEKIYFAVYHKTLTTTVYGYENAFSFPDLLQGYLEIMGEFLAPERTGGQKLLSLDNFSPITISAGDWSEFWWDENEISPIGEIDVSYYDGKEEQTQTIVVDEGGGSLYDMTENEVFLNAALDEATVTQILTDYFLPKAAEINFTPVELEMRGMPFLEAGDYITMTAKDGSTVSSYILRQEISGIQNLQANVTSTNGELIEVEA